jgi:hypothetical protein
MPATQDNQLARITGLRGQFDQQVHARMRAEAQREHAQQALQGALDEITAAYPEVTTFEQAQELLTQLDAQAEAEIRTVEAALSAAEGAGR